jgi:hypothetical protein
MLVLFVQKIRLRNFFGNLDVAFVAKLSCQRWPNKNYYYEMQGQRL